MNNQNRVELGLITGAHGVRGQVRVRFFGDDLENLLTCEEVWLGKSRADSDAKRFTVLAGGTGRGGEARLQLEGVEDRDAAVALRGLLVLTNEAQLESLPEGEFYWHELIGCQVEMHDGTKLGEVEEIWDTGAHDLLVVRNEAGRQHLIPTARELVPEIDMQARRIVIADLPGLVDLTENADKGPRGGTTKRKRGPGRPSRPTGEVRRARAGKAGKEEEGN